MGDWTTLEDVAFDEAAATTLENGCRTAASTIRGQAGQRASLVSTAMTDFKGVFSELFKSNSETARTDAEDIAIQLVAVADQVDWIREEVRKENERRRIAREWALEQANETKMDKLKDFGMEVVTLGAADVDDTRPEGPKSATNPPVVEANTTPRDVPRPGRGGGGSMPVSSARPSNVRDFATGSKGLNTTLDSKPAKLIGWCSDFNAGCDYGTIQASGVFSAFKKYNDANDEDVLWATTIADAFAAAGGEGNVSSLSNSSLTAALQAKGVDASRLDITVTPAQLTGVAPTSGWSDDPVNVATGNFIEPETDLEFAGGCENLVLTRMYNSFVTDTGAFGPGWSSWTEAHLELTDEAAQMHLADGRMVVFPRLGDGWDRASGESRWLERDADGTSYRASDNGGSWFRYASDGTLVELGSGEGTVVRLTRHEGRLVRLEHERGRSIDLSWDGDRVVAARASDGRTLTYEYDDRGRLVGVTGPLGTRTYRWDDHDLVTAVVDADGVVEAENTYDDQRRVTSQRSRFGRISRYVYLPGNTTVVSDPDGGRSNTWLSDRRGRLVGIVDSDENRQSMSYDNHGNLVLCTERDGSVTVREYDDRGRKVREVRPGGADLEWTFDDLDRVTTVTTEPGSVTRFSYDGTDRDPSLIVDPEGGETRAAWDRGLLRRLTGPTGVVVDFEHGAHGDLVAIADAEGRTARLERDTAGRIVAAVTPSGHRTRFDYDPATGLLATRTDADGGTWRFEHTTAGRISAVVDPTGSRTTREYGEHGEETRTIDPLGRAVTRHLDDFGNLASAELPDGSRWEFLHDALSRLTATTDPEGRTTRLEYDSNGHLTARLDPTGRRLDLTHDTARGEVSADDGSGPVLSRFDELGRLVASEGADGSRWLTRYDRNGRPVEYVDGAGGVTRVTRDAAGKVVSIHQPSGATLHYEYDRCGRLSAAVDATGARTTFEQDDDGRLVTVLHPDGTRSTTTYDPCGRVLSSRRPGRGTTRLTYDLASRVTAVESPTAGRREFGYDAAGQLVTATDANGHTTRYGYDDRGRVATITDPLGGVVRREYDALGNLVAETDALGRTTRAGYDARGRQLWQEDPTGVRVEWTYDEQGRFLSMVTNGVETRRVVERDLRNRRLTIDEDGTRHQLAWDARGLLLERSRNDQTVRWEHDVDGNCVGLVLPDGTRTAYELDAVGRPVAVDHPLLGRASLTRDAVGRVTAAAAGQLRATWGYDDGHVVAHESHSPAGATRVAVERDDEGRITRVIRDGVATTYEHDAAGQLVATTTDGSSVRWRYDAAGRLVVESTDQSSTELTYDAAGQLLTVRDESGTTTYEYDASGRRTRRVEADGSSEEYRWSAAGWLSGLVQLDPSGAAREIKVEVDALGELARVGDAEVFWDSADPWAAPVQAGGLPVVELGPLTGVGSEWSSAGWRSSRSGLDPWSPSLGTPVGDAMHVGRAGELWVGDLEWLKARVYDPASRGFLSVDPLDALPGTAAAGNRYAYAGNDPLHRLDPLGLSAITEAELTKYNNDVRHGVWDEVGGFLKENWEYVVGGAMVVAGGVMIATGVGGPVGMVLVSAGADVIIQKATTGGVKWDQVAVSGALGLAGGGLTTSLVKGATSLTAKVAITAGVSAVESEANYLYQNRQNLTWRGAAGAGVSGLLTGGMGTYADEGGKVASQLSMRSGAEVLEEGVEATTRSVPWTRVNGALVEEGGHFAAGFTGNVANDVISGEDVNLSEAALDGAKKAGFHAMEESLSPGTGTRIAGR